MWIHGGGFISSSAATVADYAILLAHAGYVVASLDYSLAPGAHYPVPVRQGNAALGYLAANAGRFGGDPARIVLGGDSAGAQIASQLAGCQTSPALATSMGLSAAVAPRMLRGVVLFCGLYDMSTVGGTGFPALRTYLWAYTGVRDWTSYPAISQLSTTRQVTSRYPPTFLTVGDADPFRFQAAELASALRRHACRSRRCSGTAPATTWATSTSSTSRCRRRVPPSSGRSASWPRSREAEPMPDPAAAQTPPPPPRPAASPPAAPPGPGRASRVAWWIGWLLLAVVSVSVTYGVLVFTGQ